MASLAQDSDAAMVAEQRSMMMSGVKAKFVRHITTLMVGLRTTMPGERDIKLQMPEYVRQFEVEYGSKRYRITRFLNKGGYGAAFVANELELIDASKKDAADGSGYHLGQACVMKFFTNSRTGQFELKRLETMFIKRAVTHHDCVIDVYFFQSEKLGEGEDTPGKYGMMAMKMGHLGEPLDYIGANGTAYVGYPERVIHRWVQNLVMGIEHLHTRGILHRDIKPDNMLLDLEGFALLCDFGWTRGVAVPGTESGGVKALTKRPGSVDYRAPEAEGQQYGEKIDVWALAATLKVLISAAPSAIQPSNTQPKVDEELLRTSKKNGWSKPLLKLMANMFCVKPEKRYGLTEIKKDRWFLSTLDDQGGLCTDEVLAIELVRRNPMQVYNACQDVEGKRFVAKASTFYPHAVGASFAALCDRKGDGFWDLMERFGCNRADAWELKKMGVEDFAGLEYSEEGDFSKAGLNNLEIDAVSRALVTYESCRSEWSKSQLSPFVPKWMRDRVARLPSVNPTITQYMAPLRKAGKERAARKKAAKAAAAAKSK